MKMTVGSNIKRLRAAKNITQEQLSVAMNVTCAAVSKWERGETYPDITLLQPLAYYFGVTLDELMGYDQEKVKADIDEVIALYKKHKNSDHKMAREIIVKAYCDYPNDYRIMHYYMWNMGGDKADNDPDVLLANKEEFLYICDKILGGCTDEALRLDAWNMRAKILHAEGRTDDALEIYQTKFASWFYTCGQKSEQLFAKDTEEYYYYLRKNMYELIAFAGDKLGRTVFFDSTASAKEKAEKALRYGDLMFRVADETGEELFWVFAEAFLCRIRNDLTFRGGHEDDIVAIMDKNLYAARKISEAMENNEVLRDTFWKENYRLDGDRDFLEWIVNSNLYAKSGRRAELLKNPRYVEVLNKYK